MRVSFVSQTPSPSRSKNAQAFASGPFCTLPVVVVEAAPPPPLVPPPPQDARVSKAKGDRLRVTLFLRMSGSTLHRLEANLIANGELTTVLDVYKVVLLGLGGVTTVD